MHAAEDNLHGFPGTDDQTDPPAANDETIQHTWNRETLDQVAAHARKVADVAKQRKALNDDLAASKSSLVALGMDSDAIKAAIAYSKLPEEERGTFDETYIFTRKALGCPIQEDLFNAAMQDEVTVETPRKGK